MQSVPSRIGYVVVFVRRWAEAVTFYSETLGLEVVRRNDDDQVAELRFPGGGPNLLLEQVDHADVSVEGLVGQFVGLSMFVPDIQATYEHLSRNGVRFDAQPARQSWGGILTHFFDSDDNMWSLVENRPDAC